MQPTEKSLCTLEAVCLSLVALGEDNKIRENLEKPLKKLCDIQLSFGAEVHQSKQYKIVHGMLNLKLLPQTNNRKINNMNRLIEGYWKEKDMS